MTKLGKVIFHSFFFFPFLLKSASRIFCVCKQTHFQGNCVCVYFYLNLLLKYMKKSPSYFVCFIILRQIIHWFIINYNCNCEIHFKCCTDYYLYIYQIHSLSFSAQLSALSYWPPQTTPESLFSNLCLHLVVVCLRQDQSQGEERASSRSVILFIKLSSIKP